MLVSGKKALEPQIPLAKDHVALVICVKTQNLQLGSGLNISWVKYLYPPCRANAQQPKLFVGMILILIFAEALALYGLIGAVSCYTYVSVPALLWNRVFTKFATPAVGIILASKAGTAVPS